MSKIKSLTQFRELIETGYEIEFTLNNQRWLLEPDQTADDFSEKRELGCGNYIKKFKNIKEVLDFEIDGKSCLNYILKCAMLNGNSVILEFLCHSTYTDIVN